MGTRKCGTVASGIGGPADFRVSGLGLERGPVGKLRISVSEDSALVSLLSRCIPSGSETRSCKPVTTVHPRLSP